jgi:glycosyltransferase involved in cell wall biosynthesis
MPHVVFATAGSFYPPVQGDSARLCQMIGFLRDCGWTVTVVHLHSDDHPLADYGGMRARCDGLLVQRAGPGWPRWSGESCDDWCPDTFAALVARTVCDVSADVLLVQFVYLSKCLELVPPGAPILKVIDADNVFTGRSELFERAGFAHDWFSATAEEERRGLLRADLILAIQEAEQGFLSRLVPERPVLLVPYAEPVVRVESADCDDLLFVSAPDAAAEAGIRRFVAEALPAIRRVRPRTRLLVAGRIGADLADLDGQVTLVGVVEDLQGLYREAAIVVNTAPCGTGLKVKTVSALSHGKCVVSSPAGVDGLERYPEAYVVARSSLEFAATIVGLLADRERLHATEQRAYEFASHYLDPALVYGRLDDALRAEIAAGAPT